jgi:hypothetical protein
MPQTQRTPAEKCNRNHVASSSDERRRDGLLRTAWMGIVQAFPCRPEPRGIWDESATGDDTPYRRTVEPIRAAIRAAVQSGNKQLIEKTLEGARAFCRELEADFLSLVPAESEESIVALALAETESEGPANQAEVSLAANPTCTAAESAVGPLSRHLASLAALVEGCRRAAREPRSLEATRAAFYTPRSVKLFEQKAATR